MVLGQHVGVLGEDGQVVQQEVAEVAGVQGAQPLLVGGVELGAAGRRRARPGAKPSAEGGTLSGVQPLFFQPSIRPERCLGRPPLGVDVGGDDQLLQQPLHVVGVEDGVVRLEPHELGVAAQDLGGDRVEGAQPAQVLGVAADQVGDPLAHLARRLVGEGDGQQLPRLGAPLSSRMCASRVVSTRVLPVPAPASTSTGPSVASTASRCSGLSPANGSADARRLRAGRRRGTGEVAVAGLSRGGGHGNRCSTRGAGLKGGGARAGRRRRGERDSSAAAGERGGGLWLAVAAVRPCSVASRRPAAQARLRRDLDAPCARRPSRWGRDAGRPLLIVRRACGASNTGLSPVTLSRWRHPLVSSSTYDPRAPPADSGLFLPPALCSTRRRRCRT